MKRKSNFLNACMKQYSYTYGLSKRVIQTLILMVAFVPSLFAVDIPLPQSNEIKGIVLDEITNEPLPGVNVVIDGDGAKGGAVTDIDGNFKLNVPKGTTKIVFSFIGYEAKTISFYPNKLNAFRVVTLKASTEALEEATVVAFGRQKKLSVVSAITTVSPGELRVPSSNLTTALAGRIAGLIAYQRSGEPGQDNADFFIRGITTFGSGTRPLILIDDVELTATDLARLHPDDIASFSLLKDAAATALYGARGANGVILVKTKEGKEGKISLNVRYETTISTPVSDVTEIADPITFMKLHNEAVRTRNPLAVLPYQESTIDARERGLNPSVYPVVDWKEMLFNDFTVNQRGNINLSGGGKLTNFYVALSYARDNGILNRESRNNFNNNISLNKYSVRSNVNMNVTKTTKLAIRLTGTFDEHKGPIGGGSGLYDLAAKSNPVLFPATFEPDVANQHAKHILFGNYGEGGEYMNPYAYMLSGYKQSQSTTMIAQMELSQDLAIVTEGLKFRILGNTTRSSWFDISRSYKPYWYSVGNYDKMTDVYKLSALNPEKGTSHLDYFPGGKNVSSSLYLETSLVYNHTFADKHDVSGMLVFTAREGLSANEKLLENSLPSRNLGMAGRFTYGFDSRYYVEGNFGYNGSEKFNKNNRWGFFPSAGIGWITSQENFWKNSSFLTNTFQMFKLKGTYGIVGNDNIASDRFFYISQVNVADPGKSISFGRDFPGGNPGVSISRYADDKIGWEIAHKLNVGVEMTIFDALELQMDYFRETRSNILQSRADIPSIIGLQATPRANVGEAKGEGFDMSLKYQKSFTKDLWLSVMGNFTYATSEFTIYEEPDYSTTTPWRSKVGRKLSQAEGYIAERLFIDEEDVLNSPQQMFGEYMAGDIKYRDINNDGVIDGRDMVPIGYPTTPEIIYGFGFSAGYKGFDFSCFFQGSARSSMWVNPTNVTPFVNTLEDTKGNNGVLEFIANDHWSEDNQNEFAAWPRLADYYVGNNTQTSTWFMHNGNFLRLKSAEIGYTLPQKIANKARMEHLRIYLSGTNLLNFSSFDLWDPEMGGDNVFGYPLQRVFNVGLQIKF